MKRFLNVLAIVIVSVLLVSQSAHAQDTGEPADLAAATGWLADLQQEDGGLPGFSGDSDPSITIDAIFALVAAERQGIDSGDAIDRAVVYLESGDVALTFAQTGAGQAAKLVLAMVATGGDPRDVAGVDALSLLESGPSPETGLYGTGVYDHAYVMLALASAGEAVPPAAIAGLEATQTPEGGWAFDGMTAEGAADSNTTALVIQALVASGESESQMVANAVSYLQTTIADTGGAVFQPGGETPPDAISTALVIQALIAVGEDPSAESWGNLMATVSTFQNEGGAFHFNEDDASDNIFSTVQVIPAAAGVALPIVEGADAAGSDAASVALGRDDVAREAA